MTLTEEDDFVTLKLDELDLVTDTEEEDDQRPQHCEDGVRAAWRLSLPPPSLSLRH